MYKHHILNEERSKIAIVPVFALLLLQFSLVEDMMGGKLAKER